MRTTSSQSAAARMIALLLSMLLFSGIVTDAYALDPCSHHSPRPATGETGEPPAQEDAAATVRAAHSGHAAHDAHSGHGAPDTADAPTAAEEHEAGPAANDEHSGHAGVCTCLGECTTVVDVPVPHGDLLSAARVHDATDTLSAPVTDAPASLHLVLLPYAIAPPAALSF